MADVPLLLYSCPHWLAAISYQPPILLTAISRLSHNEIWSSLYSPNTDHKETPLPTVPVLLGDATICTDHTENTIPLLRMQWLYADELFAVL
jgi:hypothetical protein